MKLKDSLENVVLLKLKNFIIVGIFFSVYEFPVGIFSSSVFHIGV